MAISYNKLWKLLVDKKMSKADLRRAAGIAPNTMTKLRPLILPKRPECWQNMSPKWWSAD